MATLLLTCLCMVGFIQIAVGNRVMDGLEDKGVFIAQNIAERSVAPLLADDLPALTSLLLEITRVDDDVEYAYVADKSGLVLTHSFTAGSPATLGQVNPLPPGDEWSCLPVDTSEGRLLDVAVPLSGGQAGVVHVGLSHKHLSAAVQEISHLLWGLVLGLVLCGSCIGVIAARSISRPIIQLRDGVEAVGRGDLQRKLPVGGKDEIGDLAASFNEMTGRLSDSRRQVELATRELEGRVAERTAELEKANSHLRAEIRERARAEHEALTTSEELAATNEELSSLYELSSMLQQVADPEELYGIVLDVAKSLLPRGQEHATALFINDGDALRLVSQDGHTDTFESQHTQLRVGQCLCGAVAKVGRVVVHDNCNDKRDCPCQPEAGPHGHVIVPLRAAGRPVGVLSMYTGGRSEPGHHNRHFLQAMGEQMGTAIANARKYQTAREDSLHDPLTGLANRRHLEVALRQAFTQARRYGHGLSLVMMDIDHFKRFNDAFGHSAGDRLLLEVGNLIRRDLRETDLAVRYGGEEFLLLMPETSGEQAFEVAERLRARVAGRTDVTISLGVASYHPTLSDPANLVDSADKALYEAKRLGRDRAVRAPEPDEAPASSVEVADD